MEELSELDTTGFGNPIFRIREPYIIYIKFYLGGEQIAYISISKIDFVSDLINKFVLTVD